MKISQRWQYAFLSFFIAIALWYSVTGRERVDMWIDLRVEILGMPQDMVVSEGFPDKISVRVSGPQGLVRNLSEQEYAYPLDLSGIKSGINNIDIEASQMPFTTAFSVVEIMPPRLSLQADSVVSKEIPLSIKKIAKLPKDMHIEDVTLSQKTVIVRGAEERLAALKSIQATVRLPDNLSWVNLLQKAQAELAEKHAPITNSTTTKAKKAQRKRPPLVASIELPCSLTLPNTLVATPSSTTAIVRIALQTQDIMVKRTVRFNMQDNLKNALGKQTVSITLRAPRSRAKDATLLEQVYASANLPQNVKNGIHDIPVLIQYPPEFVLHEWNPEHFSIDIK